MDSSTLAWSAFISATVAAVVAAAVNVALGGPMEVRKQRALERYRVRVDLDKHVRVLLNAVRLLLKGNSSWGSSGGKVKAWGNENEFNAAFEEGHQSYLAARPYVSGHADGTLENLIGEVLLASGACMNRVRKFRAEAVGQDDAAFREYHGDMRADLNDAETILQQASGYLRSQIPVTWIKRRALRKRIAELKELGDQQEFPRTPFTYSGALRTLEKAVEVEG